MNTPSHPPYKTNNPGIQLPPPTLPTSNRFRYFVIAVCAITGALLGVIGTVLGLAAMQKSTNNEARLNVPVYPAPPIEPEIIVEVLVCAPNGFRTAIDPGDGLECPQAVPNKGGPEFSEPPLPTEPTTWEDWGYYDSERVLLEDLQDFGTYCSVNGAFGPIKTLVVRDSTPHRYGDVFPEDGFLADSNIIYVENSFGGNWDPANPSYIFTWDHGLEPDEYGTWNLMNRTFEGPCDK